VEALTAAVERIIRAADHAPSTHHAYRGMPVMILENDYQSGLFNGDTGVVFPDKGVLKACFRSPENGLRRFELSRLPRHQKAWALTVHKSQGSEFGEVTIVLPAFDTPLLTRELLYTAVTRARKRVEIRGTEEIFLKAVKRRIRRFSGLAEGLG
jgi:exodeoxyribonuclease V alpha subunit